MSSATKFDLSKIQAGPISYKDVKTLAVKAMGLRSQLENIGLDITKKLETFDKQSEWQLEAMPANLRDKQRKLLAEQRSQIHKEAAKQSLAKRLEILAELKTIRESCDANAALLTSALKTLSIHGVGDPRRSSLYMELSDMVRTGNLGAIRTLAAASVAGDGDKMLASAIVAVLSQLEPDKRPFPIHEFAALHSGEECKIAGEQLKLVAAHCDYSQVISDLVDGKQPSPTQKIVMGLNHRDTLNPVERKVEAINPTGKEPDEAFEGMDAEQRARAKIVMGLEKGTAAINSPVKERTLVRKTERETA